uniref:Putative zinc finger CCCH domain-containing protein 17 n=2 Tax=Davidia involucrata TaxID=16924 RepID=A0A5B7AEE5_DAVIN
MVGATQQPPPQPQRPTTATTTTTASTSAEEEALKRNTDCVYFLASPLTCKKGSECEYRHSDIARVNPRDCWYWLNGNCLNPKCAFRHPPLDGLLGTQVPTPAGASLPASQTAATPDTHAPHTLGKQAVPCIFFQKGFCLKGDRCSFLHAPNAINNSKVPQSPAAAPVTEPPSFKKSFGGPEKGTQELKVSRASVLKSVELPTRAKPAAKVETAPPKNGSAIIKNVPPPSGLDNELSRYRPTSVPPATNGYSMNRSNRVYQAHISDDHSFLNGKDADEFSREPSPGFDVLVDDERRDSDYYHNEDQFGRTGAHEGRNLNPTNEYDIGRSANYDSMADVDGDIYRDTRGYDLYEHMQGQYGWEQRRDSSERMLGGVAHLERKRHPKAESPDQIDESDLRHRLSKQRRVNGLRSVISHDHARDDHIEDKSYQGLRREAHHLPTHESSISSRLRGRIKIPGRSSSPLNETDLRPEREMDRERNRGRLSLGRPQISSHQERVRDRIKGRVQEDFNNEGRNFRGPHMGRDVINDDNTNFSNPKSLAERKVGKYAESNEQQISYQQSFSVGKRKYPNLEGRQQSEGDLSFEGPKPLSEILKRKRGVETAVSGSDVMSSNKEDSIRKERRESLISSVKTTAAIEAQGILSSVSKEEADLPVHGNKEESKSETADSGGTEDGLIPTENIKSVDGQPSLQHNVSELENEDGMIVDDTMEDQEPEAYDQREGDSDYEQVDGEDFNLDGENADPEEEYLDDDDGDDFAKKIGVMFS